MVLPIPIRCIYFLIAYHLRTPQLSMLGLEWLWDGWPFRKFPKKHVSEDKAHWNVSCWFVGTVIDLENNQSRFSRSQKRLPTEGFDQQGSWVKCYHMKCCRVWGINMLIIKCYNWHQSIPLSQNSVVRVRTKRKRARDRAFLVIIFLVFLAYLTFIWLLLFSP